MKTKETFMNKLVAGYRNNADCLVMIAIPLAIVCWLGLEIISEVYQYHIWTKFLGPFVLGVWMFGVICPLFYIGREARRDNAKKDLLYQSIQTLANIKDGLEVGQTYCLGEVFCLDNPQSNEIQELLNKVVGNDLQIFLEHHPGGCSHKIKVHVLANKTLELQESAS